MIRYEILSGPFAGVKNSIHFSVFEDNSDFKSVIEFALPILDITRHPWAGKRSSVYANIGTYLRMQDAQYMEKIQMQVDLLCDRLTNGVISSVDNLAGTEFDQSIIDNLKRVKHATVAIALTSSPGKTIFIGSGFFVKEGFVVSSRNVLEKCAEILERPEHKGKRFRLLIYHHNPFNEYVNPDVFSFSRIQATYPLPRIGNFPGNENYNLLGIIIPDNSKRRPYLEIKNKGGLELFDEICVSGFPSGEHLVKKYSGWRFSAVIQFGRVTAFMPTDETPIPYGIQTDVIGTSGTSGSPIVDVSSGKVVAIAQGTLQTNVECNADLTFFDEGETKKRKVFFQAMADIGLVHGTSLIGRPDIFANVKRNLDNGIYETFDFLKTSLVDYTGLTFSSKVPRI